MARSRGRFVVEAAGLAGSSAGCTSTFEVSRTSPAAEASLVNDHALDQ
jgi:hypothetical protein